MPPGPKTPGPRLSLATRSDAAEILAIYNWYVLNRIATFQITPSTLEEYEQWVEDTLARAPLILARDGSGRLLGYACAHRYHPREAFDWDVESTIYCAPDACSAGVGPALYGALLELLNRQGYWNVYALLADPNPASERFHEKFGFVCVGRCPHTGYKFGRWAGLSTWWLPLRRGNTAPPAGPASAGTGGDRPGAGPVQPARHPAMTNHKKYFYHFLRAPV